MAVLGPCPSLLSLHLAGWPGQHQSPLLAALPGWAPRLHTLVLEGVAPGALDAPPSAAAAAATPGAVALAALTALRRLALRVPDPRAAAVQGSRGAARPPRALPDLSALTRLTALQLVGVVPNPSTAACLAALTGLAHLHLDLIHDGYDKGLQVLDLTSHCRLVSLVLRARPPGALWQLQPQDSHAAGASMRSAPSPAAAAAAMPCPAALRATLQRLPPGLRCLAVDLPPWRPREDASWAQSAGDADGVGASPVALEAATAAAPRPPPLRFLSCPPEMIPCLRDLGLDVGHLACLRLAAVLPVAASGGGGGAAAWPSAAPSCWPACCCRGELAELRPGLLLTGAVPGGAGPPAAAGGAAAGRAAAWGRQAPGGGMHTDGGERAEAVGEMEAAAEGIEEDEEAMLAATAPRVPHSGSDVLAAMAALPQLLPWPRAPRAAEAAVEAAEAAPAEAREEGRARRAAAAAAVAGAQGGAGMGTVNARFSMWHLTSLLNRLAAWVAAAAADAGADGDVADAAGRPTTSQPATATAAARSAVVDLSHTSVSAAARTAAPSTGSMGSVSGLTVADLRSATPGAVAGGGGEGGTSGRPPTIDLRLWLDRYAGLPALTTILYTPTVRQALQHVRHLALLNVSYVGAGSGGSGSSGGAGGGAAAPLLAHGHTPLEAFVTALASLRALRSLTLQPLHNGLGSLARVLSGQPLAALRVLRLLDVEEDGRSAAERPLLPRLCELMLALGGGAACGGDGDGVAVGGGRGDGGAGDDYSSTGVCVCRDNGDGGDDGVGSCITCAARGGGRAGSSGDGGGGGTCSKVGAEEEDDISPTTGRPAEVWGADAGRAGKEDGIVDAAEDDERDRCLHEDGYGQVRSPGPGQRRGRRGGGGGSRRVLLVLPQLLGWEVEAVNRQVEAETGGACACELRAGP
ncbi:hypothetical protein GPECTOR_45g144 [Gonium pectorale]|uniref:Uncharacterized protein n=1 Tax=Gonium pectorale TaxID=33097 RepID=A0A150G8W0_GONPE|nr:hypothetical protein GPECTOR_45g144 [Gonium pectorale]|eukprot:KXZ46274.1 hypothetical protein GPECTOR_45g144 [Gonium pectorale]